MKVTKHRYTPAPPDSPTIRTAEAADILDIAETTLMSMIAAGEIKAERVQRRVRSFWYIDRASVMAAKAKMDAAAKAKK